MMIMGTVLVSFKSSHREEHSWSRCSGWCLSCCLHRFVWCCTLHCTHFLQFEVCCL